jgi:hypothetical protein
MLLDPVGRYPNSQEYAGSALPTNLNAMLQLLCHRGHCGRRRLMAFGDSFCLQCCQKVHCTVTVKVAAVATPLTVPVTVTVPELEGVV